MAVELIHLAECVDPKAVLGNPSTVAKAGRALVPGAGVDFGEAVSH
jgi:hypothetical protein